MTDPAEVIRGLREQVFTISAKEVGIVPATGHMKVWAVVMEFARPGAVVSLVAIADGTTSLYFSNGGGMIGAGKQPAVRRVTEQFIGLVDAKAELLSPVKEHPVPNVGRVRFYARTFDGLIGIDVDEQELATGKHALSLFF